MTEDEFRALVDAHFADVWNYVRRRCVSGADADDVVADAFATAWKHRVDFPASDAVRPWLFVAARNALANHRRSGRRQQRIRLRLVGEREPALPPADAIDAMQIALQTLDADDFEVVRLRYWDRLPVTEVAAVLGVSPNAVSIRLHRIRAVLREELERPEPERRESRDVG
jgi:RNA polymerase sigma-70 factor, ECF subfamily